MLKILIKKQLAEILAFTLRRRARNGAKRGKAGSGKGAVILLIILTLYLCGMFGAMANSLAETLYPVGMGWLYHLLMAGVAVLFGTLGSVFSTYFTLYLAKDNDLLLSMPIPIRDVILSRLLGVYVVGLSYSAMVSVPAVIVGLIQGEATAATLIGGLVMVLLVSLIVLGLSCLLGWVVARLSLRLKNKSYVIVLISLVFLGLYYYVYFRIIGNLQDLLARIILMGGKIKGSAYPIYLLGRIGEGDWLGMGLWLLAEAALLALVWLVLRKSFLSIATASAGGKKAVYHEKAGAQTSVTAALLRREWLRFTASANYMLNCGMGVILLLGLGGYLLIDGRKLLRMLSLLPASLRQGVPVLMAASCCMLGAMIDITAPSVALEGKSLWQIQCLPVTPWQALRAKLTLHLGLGAAPVLFCAAVVTWLAPADLAQKLLMLALTVLFTVFIALLGLFEGIRHPNLNWTNEIIPIKQSMAVAVTMLGGLGLAMAMGGLYFLIGVELGATLWLSIFAVLFLALDAALFLWLKGPGAARFAEL